MTIYTTHQEQSQQLEALCSSIAAHLGKAWKYEKPEEASWSHRIAGEDGAALYLHFENNRTERIAISGSINIGRNNQHVTIYKQEGGTEQVPSITVAISRGTAVIAKEIERRVLPEYSRILGLARDQVAKNDAFVAKRFQNLVDLAKLAGEKIPANDERDRFTFSHDGGWGSISASDKDATLELHSISIQKAKQILAILKGGR